MATGYDQRTVGMVERGEKSPTLRTMENFATFYGVPLETLSLKQNSCVTLLFSA